MHAIKVELARDTLKNILGSGLREIGEDRSHTKDCPGPAERRAKSPEPGGPCSAERSRTKGECGSERATTKEVLESNS